MSRPLTLALAATALLLTACERPTPGVTMVSRGESVHTEAASYCHDGRPLRRLTDCPGPGTRAAVLPTRQGAQVGIDVDKDLADKGWYVVDLDSKTRYSYQDDHYLAFTADFTDRPIAGVINLEVRQVAGIPTTDDALAPVTGVWRFQLVQTD